MQANSAETLGLTPPYPYLTPFLPHKPLKYLIPYPSYPYRNGGTHEKPPPSPPHGQISLFIARGCLP